MLQSPLAQMLYMTEMQELADPAAKWICATALQYIQ